MAKKLSLLVLPVKYEGPPLSSAEIHRRMAHWALLPTGLARQAAAIRGDSGSGVPPNPKGFVVRHATSFADFGSIVAKFVRANHIQTSDDFRKN